MNAKTESSSRVTNYYTSYSPRGTRRCDDRFRNTREKRRILEAYETKFGTGYLDSIIMRKKGKLVDILELHSVIATITKVF